MQNFAFGIDLGTGNIKIYNSADDSILNEKNMIAIQNKNTLFAYGDSAFEMFEKAPGNIVISNPVTNGVIADIKNMQTVLRCFIADLAGSKSSGADYYISVPTDVTEVEKRSFYDLVRDANVKAKKIMVVEKAIADGLGLDIDVKNSQGVMIVDVGYATTEISILSLGGIVLSKLIKVGGAKFDDAIRAAVRKEFNLMIGQKTAEKVKIGMRMLEEAGESAVVYGRDIVTGLPVEREIPTTLVDLALREHFDTIIDNIKVILERTPPELAADIYRHGVYLTGGSAVTNHFGELVSQGTNLKVNIADNAADSVACGLARVIKDDKYKSVAYSIQGMSK
ncbi:MAG: rod shape-determining protein [Lachnospiraceae bacterium]|nr:rod shape-determining protein [Lachnospiraceae bacterium]MBR4175658.1 rod shape-determining protein [Lachnospiraceae bacterium]